MVEEAVNSKRSDGLPYRKLSPKNPFSKGGFLVFLVSNKICYNKAMILKGEKIVLRPIRMDDAPRFVKWFNDPDVNKFILNRSLTLPQERKYIQERLKKKAKDNLHFCIDTKEGAHIGAIDIRGIHKRDKDAGFGIIIGDKDYWGNGYGTDAMKTLLNYGFLKLKLHRVYLTVYSYNKRAIKLYEKLGFKHEGVNREGNFWNGRFWDSYRMAILDREWKRKN